MLPNRECPTLCIDRVPALITAVLLISGEKMSDTIDPSFFYSKPQVRTEVELFTCFLLCKTCFWLTKWTEDYSKVCVLWQIICTTVVVALSILLAGGSLVCLSRGSWTQNDQIQGRNSAEDLMTHVEPENQPLFDPGPSPGSPDRGTSSYGDHLSDTYSHYYC